MVTSVSLHSFAEEVPGQSLLSYFSANCKSKGDWTSIAISHSNSLIESLKSIQNDPDCKSVSGAISQLGLLSNQLASLQQMNATKSQIAEYDRQEQELLIQISGNSNADVLAQINSKLRDIQVARAGILGRQDAEKELTGQQKAQVLGNVVQITETAFSQIAGNAKCMSNNPNVLNAATGVMATVGATVALVNPALGVGLTAGAVALGSTVEGLRKLKNSREIRKISDGSVATEAYKCALETMSDHWCLMRDAESFLDFRRENMNYNRFNGDLGSAIGLSDKEIPVLLDWLNKIRSGVTPSNPADSNRQSEALTRQNYVRIMEKRGIAFINDNRAIYEEANLDEKKNIIKTVVQGILPSPSTDFRNPFYEIKSWGYAPFFILGLRPEDPSIRDGQGNYTTLDNWTGWASYVPNLEEVERNYLTWVSDASKKVNNQLTQILQPDTLLTLSLAFEEQDTRYKISAMSSLKNLINFLEKNRPKEGRFAFRKIFTDTLDKLKKIHATTESAVLSERPVEIKDVETIFSTAQLENGTVVMESRLNMIVRLSVLEFIKNTPPEDQILVAQFFAAERFSESITKFNGKSETQVRSDILRANNYSNSNLNAFADVFGKNIGKIMKKTYKEEQTLSGTLAAAKKYSRTEICFLLLAIPKLPKHIDIKMCEGLQFAPKIKGGPASITLSGHLFRADYKDRACQYREFNRQSIIFETWGIK